MFLDLPVLYYFLLELLIDCRQLGGLLLSALLKLVAVLLQPLFRSLAFRDFLLEPFVCIC